MSRVSQIRSSIPVSRIEPILLAGILVLGAGLRFAILHSRETDLDALKQIVVSDLPLDQLLSGVADHLSPPLDYFVTGALLRVGIDDLTLLRVPSAVYGILSIVLIWYLARTLTSSKAIALLSGLLLAVSQFSIDYSQLVRMYSLFLLLSILSITAFIRYRQTDSNVWLTVWIIVSILAIYTHYFSAFLILSLVVYLGADSLVNAGHLDLRSRRTLIAVSVPAIIFIAFLPWIPTLWGQIGDEGGVLTYGYENPVRLITGVLHNFSSRFPLSEGGAVVDLVFGGLALIGVVHLLRTAREAFYLLTVIGAIPLVLLVGYTVVIGPVTTPRNLIFLLPIWLILVSSGVFWLWVVFTIRTEGRLGSLSVPISWGIRLAPVLILAAGILISLFRYYDDEAGRVRFKAVSDMLNLRAAPDDLVITANVPSENLRVVYKGEARVIDVDNLDGRFENTLSVARGNTDQCAWIVLKHPGASANLSSYQPPEWTRSVAENSSVQLLTGVGEDDFNKNLLPPNGLHLACADGRP